MVRSEQFIVDTEGEEAKKTFSSLIFNIFSGSPVRELIYEIDNVKQEYKKLTKFTCDSVNV
jgi:hypothetical protein